ncbi:hypothetical protein PV325_005368 [Microctonus aethiopoides]|nr:hypothetical protein PV325_005368 [Microctonus aethiopoides]
MDIFDSVYYKVMKNLHQCIGSWPYQRRIEKYILRSFILLLNASMVIPEILNFINVRKNLNIVLDCLPIFIIHLIYMMMELFNAIKDDWLMVKTEGEIIIIHEYAEKGRKISVACASKFSILILVFYLDNITDYIIDKEKYYTPIIIHHFITAVIGITSIVAADGTYTVYVHHVCGMFTIVRDELNNMSNYEKSKDWQLSGKIRISKRITNCMENHRKAIWFSEKMESAHVVLMFILLLTSVMGLSMTGVQAMLNVGQPSEALQSVVLCLGHFVHIYYYSWNSQKILDHSSMIFDAIYNTEWYREMNIITKLLTFMMLRSTKPCIQTAGKLFPMTLMNFTVIVKTSMSYFTVLSSFQ